MNLINQVALCILMSFISILSFGQNGSITGKVLDVTTGEPIEFAAVALERTRDSFLVKSEYTELDGGFSFQNLDAAQYRISVLFMGYDNFVSELIDIEAGGMSKTLAVQLKQSGVTLKGAVVTYKQELFERKIDRTVVNVDALIANTGTSALELLKKSPGVSVNQSGTINLKGKSGVTVYVDDKPTYLSGQDLENYLTSLPASSLDKIELMSNPPAKYDAGGNGGVINIKMKKNRAEGFNGLLNLGITQSQFTQTNNSLNFNYKQKKINFYGNLSGGFKKRNQTITIYRRALTDEGNTKSITNQDIYNEGTGTLLNVKTGIDYSISDRSTLGLSFSGMNWNGKDTDDNVSNILNSTNEIDSTVTTNSKTNVLFRKLGSNLNFRHQFAEEKQDISFNIDYLNYKTNTEQAFDNSIIFPRTGENAQDFLAGMSPSSINIYSGKVDYSATINKTWKLLLGAKNSYIKTDNRSEYTITADGISRPDYEKNNHFIYSENISSAYFNANMDSKRLSIQAGLRFENTIADGLQLGNTTKPETKFKRNFRDLFPTVYLSYQLDTSANNLLGINYGRRIDRPYYRDLNPIIMQVDKFTFYEGNPYLNPSYTHNLELFHSYKNKLTTTLTYSKTKDEVNETIEIVDGTYFSRPGNIGETTIFSLSVNAGMDLTKWLTFTAYAAVTNVHAKTAFYTGTLDISGTYWNIDPVFQVNLPRKWTLEFSGSYISKVYDAQFITDPSWAINAGLKKKISDSSSFKLSATDLFKTSVNRGDITNLLRTEATYNTVWDTRRVTLTFSYRFGKLVSGMRRRGSGAESEERRVN